MAEISIIIPVYNGESTIGRTIESVKAQTFSDWEIILIDDGSTDGTLEQVREINDGRIKIFSYENSGQATARNRGITLSNSEFLAFLDADDLWTNDKLESQRKVLLENPQAGVAYSWTVVLDGEGLVQHRQKPVFFKGDVLEELLKNNFLICGSTALIRRKAITTVGYFDTNLPPVEDWDYWLRLAALYHFTVVPKYQTFYCKSKESSSSQVKKLEEKISIVIERAYLRVPPNLQNNKNKTLAHAFYYLAGQYLNYQSDAEGIKQALFHFCQALRLNPRFFLHFDTFILGLKLLLMFLFPIIWIKYLVRIYRFFRLKVTAQLGKQGIFPSGKKYKNSIDFNL